MLITNCQLFDSQDKEAVDILIEENTIAQIGKIKKSSPPNNILDAQGRIISPGFIDVHIQGAGGADVLDGTKNALETLSQTCARFGVTSFLATTIFRRQGNNQHLATAAESVGKNLGGANLLGVHLEGPFISPKKRGMILPECICPPSPQTFQEIEKIVDGSLRMMTIAPEIEGNLEIIRHLVSKKIIASFGHSAASYEETLAGIKTGISHVTHLFNAMPSLHHRQPGPLLALLENKKISAQIIPDGVHIHPAVLKWAFATLGIDRSIMITDGLQAMGLPDGKYIYNGMEYEAKNGTARYHDGTLIGTTLGLSQLLQKLMKFTGCSLIAAIKTVTENPAKILGLEKKKGTIAVGKDADLVILNNDYSPWATIVGGKIVFQRKK